MQQPLLYLSYLLSSTSSFTLCPRLTAAGPRAPGHLAIDGGLTTPPPPPRRACRTHVGAGGGCMRATCSGVGSPGRWPRRRRAYVVLYAHVRQRQRHLVRVLDRCISPAGLGDDHTSSTVYIRRSICVLKTGAPVLDPPRLIGTCLSPLSPGCFAWLASTATEASISSRSGNAGSTHRHGRTGEKKSYGGRHSTQHKHLLVSSEH